MATLELPAVCHPRPSAALSRRRVVKHAHRKDTEGLALCLSGTVGLGEKPLRNHRVDQWIPAISVEVDLTLTGGDSYAAWDRGRGHTVARLGCLCYRQQRAKECPQGTNLG